MQLKKIDFQEALLQAVSTYGGFDSKIRPHGIKFKLDKAIIRNDINEYNGFSTGDKVELNMLWYNEWLLKESAESVEDLQYYVCGFVELNGSIKNNKIIEVRDIFCPLIPVKAENDKKYSKDNLPIFIEKTHFVQPFVSIPKSTLVRLYWANGLKKVK